MRRTPVTVRQVSVTLTLGASLASVPRLTVRSNGQIKARQGGEPTDDDSARGLSSRSRPGDASGDGHQLDLRGVTRTGTAPPLPRTVDPRAPQLCWRRDCLVERQTKELIFSMPPTSLRAPNGDGGLNAEIPGS